MSPTNRRRLALAALAARHSFDEKSVQSLSIFCGSLLSIVLLFALSSARSARDAVRFNINADRVSVFPMAGASGSLVSGRWMPRSAAGDCSPRSFLPAPGARIDITRPAYKDVTVTYAGGNLEALDAAGKAGDLICEKPVKQIPIPSGTSVSISAGEIVLLPAALGFSGRLIVGQPLEKAADSISPVNEGDIVVDVHPWPMRGPAESKKYSLSLGDVVSFSAQTDGRDPIAEGVIMIRSDKPGATVVGVARAGAMSISHAGGVSEPTVVTASLWDRLRASPTLLVAAPLAGLALQQIVFYIGRTIGLRTAEDRRRRVARRRLIG